MIQLKAQQVAYDVTTPTPTLSVYVNADTGSNANDGSEAFPLETLEEVRKRIGDGAGDYNIFLGGANGTSYNAHSFAIPRVGKGITKFIGQNTVWTYEGLEILNIATSIGTDDVITVDQLLSLDANRGKYAVSSLNPNERAFIVGNTTAAFRLADNLDGATTSHTLSVGHPGIKLNMPPLQTVCGPNAVNINGTDDVLHFKNVDLESDSGILYFSGSLVFEDTTFEPNVDTVYFYNAYLSAVGSGRGFSHRAADTSGKQIFLSKCTGAISGYFGGLNLHDCSGSLNTSQYFIAQGGAIRVDAFNSKTYLTTFYVSDGNVGVYDGYLTTNSVNFNAATFNLYAGAQAVLSANSGTPASFLVSSGSRLTSAKDISSSEINGLTYDLSNGTQGYILGDGSVVQRQAASSLTTFSSDINKAVIAWAYIDDANGSVDNGDPFELGLKSSYYRLNSWTMVGSPATSIEVPEAGLYRIDFRALLDGATSSTFLEVAIKCGSSIIGYGRGIRIDDGICYVEGMATVPIIGDLTTQRISFEPSSNTNMTAQNESPVVASRHQILIEKIGSL